MKYMMVSIQYSVFSIRYRLLITGCSPITDYRLFTDYRIPITDYWLFTDYRLFTDSISSPQLRPPEVMHQYIPITVAL